MGYLRSRKVWVALWFFHLTNDTYLYNFYDKSYVKLWQIAQLKGPKLFPFSDLYFFIQDSKEASSHD